MKCVLKRVEDYLKDHNAEPGDYSIDFKYQALVYYDRETNEGYVDRPIYFIVSKVIYHSPSGEDITYVQLYEGEWAHREGKSAY